MSEYPDPDEEFELMYGDELELLKEQEEEEYRPPSKSRKSLNFTTPSSQKNNVDDITPLDNSQQSLSLFQNDSLSVTSQTDLNQYTQIEPSNSKKRTVDELFGDITDIGDDLIFEDEPNAKKSKGDKVEEDLALIEHILELRKLSKEKHSITVVKKDYTVSNKERDKRNLSYCVPKYPFIGVTRLDNERVYIRFHSEDYEKEERERIIKECSFTGVMGDNYKGVWREAQTLVRH